MTSKEKRKQEILNNFKQESDSLEKELKSLKIKNLTINRRRFVGKSFKLVEYIGLHVWPTVIILMCFLLAKRIPFHIDEYDKYAYYEVMQDSLGDFDLKKEYRTSGFSEKRLFEYYTPWELIDNSEVSNDIRNDKELYKRNVITGEYKEKDSDYIRNSLKTGTIDIESIKISNKDENTEYTNNPEETYLEPYFKAQYYFKDEEDIFKYVETPEADDFSQKLFIILAVICGLGVNITINTSLYDRIKISNELLRDYFEDVNKQYGIEDTKALEKQLKLSRENYERLTRGTQNG